MSKKDINFISLFYEKDAFIPGRVIEVNGEITLEMVTMHTKSLELMLAQNEEKPITLRITTYGGDPYAAFKLYDFLKDLPVEIITEAQGAVMSAGTIIFAAGNKRYMTPNTRLMFHSVSDVQEGKAFDLDINVKECMDINNKMCDIYATASKKSSKWWQKKIKYEDLYLGQEEALELGLIEASEDE